MKYLLIGWLLNVVSYFIIKRGSLKRHGGSTGEAGMEMAWVAIFGIVPYSLPVMGIIGFFVKIVEKFRKN